MIPKTLRNFIQVALTETENGNLSWNEADASAYFCDHKTNTLHIASYFDGDRGQTSFVFRIVVNGKVTPFTVRDNEDEDFETMRNLYEAVIANANNIGNDISGFFSLD
jgi:hypothetical protein